MEATAWDDGYPKHKGWVRCGCDYVRPAWGEERGCGYNDCEGGFHGSDGGVWIDWEFKGGATKRRWYCDWDCATWTAEQLCECDDSDCLCGG
ncbi:hypothetical protein F53441_6652 [Fusarium austroafricanum]|uniref:Uncharacterized protein n=1 Tax=Fusarium austroafricanum TaxID=2364996 RepID=A0A8H4KIA2_9HYPO|nr:hypothetical protein F53441_6652 [Fusarium austroafricanum]